MGECVPQLIHSFNDDGGHVIPFWSYVDICMVVLFVWISECGLQS